MQHSYLTTLFLCLVGAVQADLAIARSQRTFHQEAGRPVMADLLVAYQDPQAGLFASQTDLEAFLKELIIKTSKELYRASGSAVQLGKVTIVPASIKSDPDILILADPSGQNGSPCPASIQMNEETATAVCGDASTGGYVGTKWWEATKELVLSDNTKITVFDKGDDKDKEGARVTVSWKTLKDFGQFVLVHELGHYLFSMRDEYEASYFTTTKAYEDALSVDPKTTAKTGGTALATASPPTTNWTLLNSFVGYPMGLVSAYKVDGKKLFSPYATSITGTPTPDADEVNHDGDGSIVRAVAEQYATMATRTVAGWDENRTIRYGGLWSLETSIRTGLGANYSLPKTGALPAYDPLQEQNILVLTSGQHNVFLYDVSWSMTFPVSGSNPAGLVRRDIAIDMFGRLTHDELLANEVRYPAYATFDFISFADQIREPFGPAPTLADMKLKTASQSREGLIFKSSTDANGDLMPPAEWEITNLTGGLAAADAKFLANTSNPVQRNVILISDGDHCQPHDPDNVFTGDESKGKGYRLFLISLDTKLSTNDQYGHDGFGDKMSRLATQSLGPDGYPGECFFADGYTAHADLTAAANTIVNKIAGFDVKSFPATDLYADAAGGGRFYSLAPDANQKRAQFAISWVGDIAPTVMLSIPPNGTSTPEGNYPGIGFRKERNFKSFDLDLTKFPVGTWTFKVSAPNAFAPVKIFPSVATKSTTLQVAVSVDPKSLYSTGKLPVSVTVQDKLPIQGLQVTATLVNRATGVNVAFPLNWTGSTYSGILSGNLQAGLNDLNVSVVHPRNGKVFYAPLENRIPDNKKTPYPVFATREQSQQIFVPGMSELRGITGLEAWTINTNPRNAQGTSLKLFLKNNTSQTFTGLKARYFFSVSEYPNGVPGFNRGYLPQSKVTVGNVDKRPGLSYVEYSFAGVTLLPGQSTSFGTNGGEDGSVIEANWSSAASWNSANDWSAKGLSTTWAPNTYVNIYDVNGNLLVGNPDLEDGSKYGNASPLVTITNSDLMAAGTPVLFTAQAMDPEGDSLSYGWTVDGVLQPVAVSSKLTYNFATAGTHAVSVRVTDNGGSSPTNVTKMVVIQPASGACTDINTAVIGAASAGKNLNLKAGANCFTIQASQLPRDWKWKNVQFQLNSETGIPLNGISVAGVPTGTSTNLSGYSQSVLFADPGQTKNLYFKVQTTAARTVRSNWWLIH